MKFKIPTEEIYKQVEEILFKATTRRITPDWLQKQVLLFPLKYSSSEDEFLELFDDFCDETKFGKIEKNLARKKIKQLLREKTK